MAEVPTQVADGHAEAQSWSQERAEGKRFAFGGNWQAFLGVLDDERVRQAEVSLTDMLEVETFAGFDFLDAGCGSGLFSLAAARLGASRVRSFDYDPESVACAEELRRRFGSPPGTWTIEGGSVLDTRYLESLGTWDIVYSWGVLHHTGDMWRALEEVASRVKPGGLLYVALYNDQGTKSLLWRRVKMAFNRGPISRAAVLSVFLSRFVLGALIKDLALLRNPLKRYGEYRRNRGMSLFHDWIDWLGGLPFEVAKPGDVLQFLRERGFTLRRLRTCGGTAGCNEFVLVRSIVAA